MNILNNDICGVILASEVADNHLEFKDTYQRGMLEVGNKPIILHQIESMREAGIKKIIIVVKNSKERITSFFKDGKNFGMNISYFEQEQNLGLAHAIGQLEKYIETPFLLFLGNIYFVAQPISELLKAAHYKNASSLLITQKTLEPGFSGLYYGMTLHESGMVKRVVEKPHYMNSPYKGTGLFYFQPVIFDAIRRTPRTAMRDKYEITDSIQILIDDGYPVYQHDSISWYRHIITPKDLLLCNNKYLELSNKASLIGEKANINPKAEIINSVIGNNVKIVNPIKIRNSVIFNDANVSCRSDIESSIVYSDGSIQP